MGIALAATVVLFICVSITTAISWRFFE